MKSKLQTALAAARDTKALHVGNGETGNIAHVFNKFFPGKSAIVVADTNTFRVAGQTVVSLLQVANIEHDDAFIFTDPNLYAEYSYVDLLVARLGATDAIPIAVGSGTVNDLCKLSSHLTDRSYLCVATAASMDGYTSYGASITSKGAKQTFDCPAPRAVVADLDIICNAPAEMTAAGYADLFAKVTAGADWLLADALGIEPIDSQAWSIVQSGLHEALADPEGMRAGRPEALSQLIEGLMMSGFAMQWLQSSRPASGAEHYFSHLWDMEGHRFRGKHVSHGFQVSIGTLSEIAFYEQALNAPLDRLDIEAACHAWPEWPDLERQVTETFRHSGFLERCLNETRAKYITREQLASQLHLLKEVWPTLKIKIEKQLVPYATARERLHTVGAPVTSEEIGITHERLLTSFRHAPYIRSRFTILDLALRTGMMEEWTKQLKNNPFPSI